MYSHIFYLISVYFLTVAIECRTTFSGANETPAPMADHVTKANLYSFNVATLERDVASEYVWLANTGLRRVSLTTREGWTGKSRGKNASPSPGTKICGVDRPY